MRDHTVVTGCAGFIGSHLCDRLLSEGKRVLGIDSFEDYYPRPFKEANLAAARAHEHFYFLEADLLDMERPPAVGRRPLLVDALQGSRCVYHLAAQAGVRGSWGRDFELYTRNNILSTQRVLEACVTAEVPRVVFASSSSVYGNQTELPLAETARCRPVSPYGVTKLAGEHLCELYRANHGLPTVALRFFTVYGPRQRPDMAFHKFIRALLGGNEIRLYGDGSQTRDFTYIDDIVDGLVSAEQAQAGAVINLGGGSRLPLRDVLRVLEGMTGVEARVVEAPRQRGDVQDTWADLTSAAELLSYKPRIRLEEGLRRELEWWRAAMGGVASHE